MFLKKKWEEDNQEKEECMKITKDKKHLNLYRINWPNGDISVSTSNPDKKDGHYGFYNKTRAKEYIRLKEVKNLPFGLTYIASPTS